MSGPEIIEQLEAEYEAAMHAMQTGIAILGGRQLEPKHLRVGVNSALVSNGALVRLLVDKGVLTSEEYLRALRDDTRAEVKRYEAEIHKLTGRTVKLG